MTADQVERTARSIKHMAGFEVFATSGPDREPGMVYAINGYRDVLVFPTMALMDAELRRGLNGRRPVVSMAQARPCPDCTWKTRNGCETCLGIGMVTA